jgi:hypothetical protein
LNGPSHHSSQQSPDSPSSAAAVKSPDASTKPVASLSPKEILQQARNLDKRWKASNAGKSTELIQNIEVNETKAALITIKPGTPEYADAQKLIAALKQDQEIGEKAQQAAIANALVETRREFAKQLERNSLEQGISVDVTTSGPKDTILTYSYVLVSKAFVYKVGNDTDLLEKCRVIGFKKIIFTDGYDHSWTYDLTK